MIDLEHQDHPGVEIRISAERANDFVAANSGENLMPTVEKVVQKLEQQLKRHKEKITSHRNQGRKTQVEVEVDTEE